MAGNTSLYFPPFNAFITYDIYDVVQGVSATDSNFYYSTIPNNFGNSPSGNFTFAITNYSRAGDITTITYTSTGNAPPFGRGSIVAVAGVSVNTSVNYTGMIIQGGSGTFSFVNPGWAQTQAVPTGTVTTRVNPAWTTGCYWTPGYSSPIDTQQSVITAAFEPGYEQRQLASINSNIDQWSIIYADRSSREARAIKNFFQSKGGASNFEMMIPDPMFHNQPNQKFVTTTNARILPKSYNINDVSVTVKRVFDL